MISSPVEFVAFSVLRINLALLLKVNMLRDKVFQFLFNNTLYSGKMRHVNRKKRKKTLATRRSALLERRRSTVP